MIIDDFACLCCRGSLLVAKKGNDRSPESQQVNKIFKSFQVKDFFNWSRAANSAFHTWIWPNFELI